MDRTRAVRPAPRHECSRCGGRWLHAELANALEGGRWVQSQWEDDAPFPAPAKDRVWLDGEDGVLRDSNGERQAWPRSVGFALWGGYSPWRDWTEMVALWLQCQANPAKLQAFVEQQLARPWTKATEAVTEGTLKSKRVALELVRGMPPGAETMIVATDVQKDWLCSLVTAWARPDRGWVLERREHHGGIEVAAGAWLGWADWIAELAERRRIVVAVDVGYMQSAVLASVRVLCANRRLPAPGKVRYLPCKGSSQGLDAPVFRMTRSAPRLALIGHSVKRWQMAALASGRIALADTLEDECLRELAAEEVPASSSSGRTNPPTASHAPRRSGSAWLARHCFEHPARGVPRASRLVRCLRFA